MSSKTVTLTGTIDYADVRRRRLDAGILLTMHVAEPYPHNVTFRVLGTPFQPADEISKAIKDYLWVEAVSVSLAITDNERLGKLTCTAADFTAAPALGKAA